MRLGEVDRFLVPEGDRGILSYFLDRLFVAHGARERLLWRLLRSSGGRLGSRWLFDRTWRLDPDGLALRPEEARRSSRDAVGRRWTDSSRLLRAVAETAADLPGMGPSALWRSILLRDYGDTGRGKLVLFPFPRGAGDPSVVVKVGRRPESGGERPGPDARLREEWRTLDRLTASLPERLRSTVPTPLAHRASERVELLAVSHLAGRPAYAEMQNFLLPGRRVEAHLRAAEDWLSAFQCATRRPGEPFALTPEDRSRASRLAGAGGGAPPAWYRALEAGLRAHRLPLSAAHGDFWARNLLMPADGDRPEGEGHARGSDAAGVVDWEHFAPAAPPFVDPFHFAVAYGSSVRWRGAGRLPLPEAFRLTFLEENTVSRALAGFLRRWAERAGLRPDLLDPLFRLYVLRRIGEAAPEELSGWEACWRPLAVARAPLFGEAP